MNDDTILYVLGFLDYQGLGNVSQTDRRHYKLVQYLRSVRANQMRDLIQNRLTAEQFAIIDRIFRNYDYDNLLAHLNDYKNWNLNGITVTANEINPGYVADYQINIYKGNNRVFIVIYPELHLSGDVAADTRVDIFWDNANGAHNAGGPARTSWIRSDGVLSGASWFINGRQHRDGAPAVITFFSNGHKMSEKWIVNDRLHRSHGPAITNWSNNGIKVLQSWYKNGQLHRNGERPALIERHYNGKFKTVASYKKGRLVHIRRW